MKKTQDGDVWATDEDVAAQSRIDWAAVAEKIKNNPGMWYCAARKKPRNYTSKIHSGEFRALVIPGFTVSAIARNSQGDFGDIWVKAEVDS